MMLNKYRKKSSLCGSILLHIQTRAINWQSFIEAKVAHFSYLQASEKMGTSTFVCKASERQIWSSKRSKPKCQWGSREKRITFKVMKRVKCRKRSVRPYNLVCSCLIFCCWILMLIYYLFEIPLVLQCSVMLILFTLLISC